MSWTSPPHPNIPDQHQGGRSSILRYNSNASTASSAYSMSSNPFPPSRTSTVSSSASSGYSYNGVGHKRGISDMSPTRPTAREEPFRPAENAASGYKSVRQSLRPLPQAPNASIPPPSPSRHSVKSSSENHHQPIEYHYDGPAYTPDLHQPLRHQFSSTAPNRGGSVTPMSSNSVRRSQHMQTKSHDHHRPNLTSPDFTDLNKSSTPYLKNLSKFAQNSDSEDFSSAPVTPSVAGLSGRKQLKRAGSVRPSKSSIATANSRGSAWSENNWMEKQRQFIQAYEYLCHIGEAKEWIEDVIHQHLPPIVQLEEALRDGVALAEIVQAFYPNQPIRIFRNPKLQFRHSDNIALFFRFLTDMELPELFRFELIDLYEKKNIPKVIHCIHALSWLLFRKGLVDFRIGNLVGQLEFEHHELEEMQKGLDKAGVSMPSFSGMGASFGAEPEPLPPEPVETEEERIARELGEHEMVIFDLQSQMRGSIIRMNLGSLMQGLWDSEEALVDLQSMIRGRWSREIANYRYEMRLSSIRVQSAARGFLVRAGQRQRESYWKERQDQVVTLQSLARARHVRLEQRHTRSLFRREESGIRGFQASVRGALQRKQFDDQYEETHLASATIDRLQASIRGALRRKKLNEQHEDMQLAAPIVRRLQASIRGALQRKRIDEQYEETQLAAPAVKRFQASVRGALQRRMVFEQLEEAQIAASTICKLQASVRGQLLRRSLQADKKQLQAVQRSIISFQAAARAAYQRSDHERRTKILQSMFRNWQTIQSAARGLLYRRRLQSLRARLSGQRRSICAAQAVIRAAALRGDMSRTQTDLSRFQSRWISLQAHARSLALRRRLQKDQQALQAQRKTLVKLESSIRGLCLRRRLSHQSAELQISVQEFLQLQALSRAMFLRSDIGGLLGQLEDEEPMIEELQSAIRGKLVRAKFAEKQRFFKSNMEKVVKVQSFVRARLQGEAYKSLTNGTNPPVGTVKNFVHLLNDSDFDFDEEVEFERLRKTVVQHVRQNEMADQYITQLDIKIALLVKNKITLDEVVKHQKHFGGAAGSLLTNKELSSKDPFDLKALNKTSRRKLEHYQELFFILQTQPQYLARIFRRIREQALAEKECERIKHLMMGLFGYAQKRREEYYLIKLISRSLREEIEHSPSLQDYLRSNFYWGKIFGAYTKSPRDRKYMRDVLGPIVKESIIDNPELDLESDPMQIYLSAIEDEELRTGQRSQRSPDIPREAAIRDPETKRNFITHLQDLRDIADQFFLCLEEQLHKMPFGVRYIAQQMYEALVHRFHQDERGHILQIVGHWVWKSYLQPALTEPEKFGVVDRGLSQEHKRSIGEVSKVVGQVAAGRLFGGENVFLQPLNSYVGESIERLGDIWGRLIDVPKAEAQFDIDEFNDLYARTKPTLYIKMTDIIAIHHLVAAEVPFVCQNRDDILQEVVHELGSAKNNESELRGVSSSEICLTLNPKLHEAEDPDAEVKALFMETKRCILYIIRVQSGGDLMDIMVKPITMEDEDRWDALVRDELSGGTQNKGAYSEANTLMDIASMSYAELKRTALENIVRLEQIGRLTRHNHYQDVLNAIAVDIRTKHRRRVQRQRELETVRLTLARLNDQAVYLEGQLKTYNDYIEQAMMTLQNKKGKKRFLMPFTKQWDHERELARSGRVPKFGSFKYSAQELANRGILLSWAGYSERQYQHIDLTISSNEVGVFTLEGSNGPISMPGASAQVPLDDLLQAQYNNTQVMEFFDEGGKGGGGLRVNVNLFLHLIMRKFYKDRE